MENYRIERDSLGEIRVPSDALYGAQTQRAVENFPVSGLCMPQVFLSVVALIKSCAAQVNTELGLLDPELAHAISAAADEIVGGGWSDQFPLDVFQTGSGTSTNMNVNEVIANRADQILGFEKGSKKVHPNDHVNLCQSSNDVIPTAIHVSAMLLTKDVLLPALAVLHQALLKRAKETDKIVITGRTHLMDAVPLLLGQEISGWAYQVTQSIERIGSCLPRLEMLALGGTAVGTGINAHPEFARRVIKKLNERTAQTFRETDNHFAAQASLDTIVELSGQLKATAAALMKISNDLRLMNSGPVAGLAEIALPEVQPGSSIMPGKVNPVICESVLMACCQVIGNDAAITAASHLGTFQLNTGQPLIAYNILQSITLLGNGSRLLAEKAVSGFRVNEKHIVELLGRNPILATFLAPKIGYDRAALIVKKAREQGVSIKEVAAAELGWTKEEIDRLLDPALLSKGGMIK
jgi:fumarate hydratase, class II